MGWEGKSVLTEHSSAWLRSTPLAPLRSTPLGSASCASSASSAPLRSTPLHSAPLRSAPPLPSPPPTPPARRHCHCRHRPHPHHHLRTDCHVHSRARPCCRPPPPAHHHPLRRRCATPLAPLGSARLRSCSARLQATVTRRSNLLGPVRGRIGLLGRHRPFRAARRFRRKWATRTPSTLQRG